MNDQRLEELLLAWEDDTLTADELAELKQLLATDAQARQRLVAAGVLRHVAEKHVKALPTAEPARTARTAGLYRKPARFAWLQWRPLTAAAAGVVLGMFGTSMVWAYVSPYAGKVVTLLRESFESGVAETSPSLSHSVGVWSGDEARVVTEEQGIQPKHGTKMLRFLTANFAGEDSKVGAWGDVYRWVDLRGRVTGKESRVRLSAAFDGTQFPAGHVYSCSLELCALASDLADTPQPLTLPWVRENSASVALRKFPMKGDGQWQSATMDVPVSAQTQFVLVHLSIQRIKPYPPTEPVHFGGHYVDNVKLELVTPPAEP